MRGISLKASEGFWEQSLHDYLTAEGFVFVNIYRRHILGAGDFWPHEGHPTAEGNRKIAQALLEGIEPLRRKVL